MWISMLQAQNPRLVCHPSTTTQNFRQAIEKSVSIDSYTCGIGNGMTFKVESHQFHDVHMYRSVSECGQQNIRPSLQHSNSDTVTEHDPVTY